MAFLRRLRGEWLYLRRWGLFAWAAHLYKDKATRTWLLRWFWLISLGFLLLGLVVILQRLGLRP